MNVVRFSSSRLLNNQKSEIMEVQIENTCPILDKFCSHSFSESFHETAPNKTKNKTKKLFQLKDQQCCSLNIEIDIYKLNLDLRYGSLDSKINHHQHRYRYYHYMYEEPPLLDTFLHQHLLTFQISYFKPIKHHT